MNKIEKAWAELMKLPDGEQDVAAEAILDYTSGAHRIELSNEQATEVEWRLGEGEPASLTIAEFRARLKKLGA